MGSVADSRAGAKPGGADGDAVDVGMFALVVAHDGARLAAAAAERTRSALGLGAGPADRRFAAALHASFATHMRTALLSLAGGDPPPRELAADGCRCVTAAVEARMPVAGLLEGYGIAHAVLLDALIEAVGGELQGAALTGVVKDAVARLSAWFDRLSALSSERFMREEQRVHEPDRRRLSMVTDLLDGGSIESAALGYELSLNHLAAIGWGDAAAVAVASAARLLGRTLFFVHASGDVVWAWLGARPGPGSVGARAIDAIELPARTYLSFGDALAGVEGFCASHRQALEARRVALGSGRAVTRYHAVALESLALQDAGRALEFATRELGALDADGPRAALERETLRAYFASGHNASSAAARLGVKYETVAKRLRRIEERLGTSVVDRRAELELALRLRALRALRSPE